MRKLLLATVLMVLLAPAAASLDMFANYGARGDAFAKAVRAQQGPTEGA